MGTVINNANFSITGDYRDIITHADGTITKTPWQHNLVVSSITKLIAALISGNMTSGTLYWAIGSGDPAWDDAEGTENGVPEPELTETRLTSEIGRKVLQSTNVEFYSVDNEPTEDVTNKLHISVRFNEDECNGDWREFGLFGGDDATVMMNTGIMLDKKHHGIITKTSDTTIERHLILTFNIQQPTS